MPKKTAPGIDITKLIKKDHNTVKRLFDQFEETNDRAAKKKKAIADTICEELVLHARLEEEIFYPVLAGLRSKDAKRMAGEAKEEHGMVKILIQQITKCDAGSPELTPKMKVLKDMVMHHVKEEEKEIFSQAREYCSDEQLSELGGRFEVRKQELQSGEEMEEEETDGRGSRRYPQEEEGAWESA